MKKICFFVHNINGSGGDTRVAVSNINGIVENSDCSVTVLTLEDIVKYRKDSFKLHSSVHVVSVTHEIHSLKKEFISISRKIRKHFQENRYDLLVVSGMDFVPFVFLSLYELRKTKKVAWEHMNYNVGEKLMLISVGRKIAIRCFNQIVVLTERDKENYQKNISSPEKIVRIYNPISTAPCKKIKYNPNNKKILSCGFLVEQKGFDFAIEIAAKVLPMHPEWTWEVWGDGSLRHALEEKIAKHHLEGRFIMKGYSDQMIDKYSEYSVFALTSRFEGFGMVLVEALQQGVPSLSFDIDAGPSELIRDEENGYLIPAFNTDEYANKLCSLIEDSEKLIRFSNNSTIELEKLSQDRVVSCWINQIVNC